MFYLTGIVISLFLTVLLFTKKNKSKADVILAVWLLATALHLVLFYIYFTKPDIYYSHLLGIELGFPLLHGPLLYLYTASLTNQSSGKRRRFLHFIPFLFTYFLFYKFFFNSIDYKLSIYEARGLGYELETQVQQTLIMASGVVYVILSLVLLKRHKKNIVREFSDLEKINLAWLRYLILGMSIIWVFVILGEEQYIFGSVVLFTIFLGYFGIKQVGIFTQIQELRYSEPYVATLNEFSTLSSSNDIMQDYSVELDTQKVKYNKSGLTEELAKEIHDQLKEVVETQKMFKNSELTLTELSQFLNVNANYLSQVINSIEQKNFYDYLNSQRIEEFKRLVRMPESQKYTLLALAYDCGFNSKTSFNRNFKNTTGISPSEYLKQKNVKLMR